jgi:uncharacterized protein VirK/YbjX
MTPRQLHMNLPSLVTAAHHIYPYHKLGTLKNRLRFITACMRHREELCDLLSRDEHRLLREELVEYPQTLGFVEWPYIHAGWSLLKRFEALSHHRQAVESDMSAVNVSRTGSLLVADLTQVSKGLRLTIDRAYWHMREGGLVFNQFVNDERLMTLAFSFGWHNGERVAYVGSVQGSNTEGAPAIYRELGRDLHGMRSRDFLVKAFQYLMHHLGVRQVLCVSDRFRHHRHAYFTRDVNEKYHMDYDQVWQEHNGEPTEDGFYRLLTPPAHRPMDTIAAKNRGLYRRRHAMLDELSADLQTRFGAHSAAT